MKKKWLLIVLGITACALLVVVMLALSHRHPLVNRENFERIEVGMHRSKVEAILGRPPGKRELEAAFRCPPGRLVRNPLVTVWVSDGALGVASKEWPGARDDEDRVWSVIVSFDADDIVQDKCISAHPLSLEPSWFRSIWPF
jgi:hypothetical protein